MSRVALKDCAWERVGDTLVVVAIRSRKVELYDPDGSAEALFTALAAGPQTVSTLSARLRTAGVETSLGELTDALRALDAARLLDDPDAAGFGDAVLDERHFSNLAFFQAFGGLDATPREMQERLLGAHVLQLGTGGLGSNVLQSLAGLGVGRLTILDCDLVEPRNFARQFLYRQKDLGRSKVERAAEWLREYDYIDVRPVQRRIGGPADLMDLLSNVDVVSSGIDQPNDVDYWVNEACMRARVPWVRGGMGGTRLSYFSVDPGRSACLACRRVSYERNLQGDGVDAATARLIPRIDRVNRGIGPVAALLGALVSFEVLRYLTRFEPPYAAGADVSVECGGGLPQQRDPWPADASCELCALAGRPDAVAPVR